MPRHARVAATVLAAALAFAAVPAAATPSAPRGMWVWAGPDHDAIGFAQTKGVDTLYVNAVPGFSASAAHADFISAAHAAGIAVHALGGDPTWATSNSDDFHAWVDEVVAYGGFDGIHADVEPYLLPEWSSRNSRVVRQYLRSLKDARARAGALDLHVAVPFWFDDPAYATRKGATLVERVLDTVDGIVVMAYRDHAEGPDGIVELAATEVALATAEGKPAVVAVETAPAGLDKISFAEEGESVMEHELALVRAAFAGQRGFAGEAVHYYGSWLSLGG